MRKSLWLIPVLLLFAAIGAPNAHADIVNVTVPTTTITGLSNCPSPSGTCMETFSTSFAWNNSTESIIPASITTSASGPLGNFTFLFFGAANASITLANGTTLYFDTFQFSDSAVDAIILPIPSTSTGSLLPGTYTLGAIGFAPNLICNPFTGATCSHDFGGANGTGTLFSATAIVSPVPEPGTVGLMLIGIGLVLVMRKRIAWGLRQAT